ncbi:hypothetical protein [Piscinibacter sp. HJYY11]|uniref:hypothetical protein n=1 Tax=Piscinibacter sp. HJYY11 TaxID=2801333 RepID=UPI001F3BB1FD|nr:hypothetical protein [Piscinibacter sp. HJYY11]
MNRDLLQPSATITAALITNPAAGVAKSKLADVATLFATVYIELEKAEALVDKMREQPAKPPVSLL